MDPYAVAYFTIVSRKKKDREKIPRYHLNHWTVNFEFGGLLAFYVIITARDLVLTTIESYDEVNHVKLFIYHNQGCILLRIVEKRN